MTVPPAPGRAAAPILSFGHPALRRVCEPVGAADADVARHLDGVLTVDRAVPIGNRPSIVARENRELALPPATEGSFP